MSSMDFGKDEGHKMASNMISDCDSLRLFIAPKNIGAKLRLPVGGDGKWYDEDGTICPRYYDDSYVNEDQAVLVSDASIIYYRGETPQIVYTRRAEKKAAADAAANASATTDTIKKGETFTAADNNCKCKITGTDTANPTVTITGFSTTKKISKTLNVPATVKYNNRTYTVTGIGKNAYKKNKTITKVKIPASVTTIEDGAFDSCAKLTQVTIGKNVTKIGKNAFKGCKKLSKITISSKKLTKVSKGALKGIKANCKIKVPKKCLAKYKKLFKGKGQKKSVKITA
ncbi:MAG: leucine-rich repeat domain-containing protein [Lachnospiraceae bacterium]|nr:leucine-rich repeat domain-containing protein [Lachnospiraceae bacterium]